MTGPADGAVKAVDGGTELTVSGRAILAPDFEKLMTAVGPFETAPVIAVAVSGGRDSMALCLLTDDWARARDGRAIALVVDHGLRQESAGEAAVVAGWLRTRRIETHVLAWTGEKPKSRIQEVARDARYGLLGSWCRRHGVLHLALGHHQEDQAETFLLRLSRGSGEFGLSGMSAVVDIGDVRLIRPLLRVPGKCLGETLRQRRQEWIEDPSNRNRAYARVRARDWLAALETAGVPPSSLAGLANGFGKKRIETEAGMARLLAASCDFAAAGYAVIEIEKLLDAPTAVTLYGLGQVARTIGGGNYLPNRKKLTSILDWMTARPSGGARTLAGCRFIRRSPGRLLVCRENRRLPAAQRLSPGSVERWDKRFMIHARAFDAPRAGSNGWDACRLLPLGRDGWRDVVGSEPHLRETSVPYPARLTLPAVADDRGIREVPTLGYLRKGLGPESTQISKIEFKPANALSGVGFCLA